ncbi:MAG TPA: hypothetical protein VMU01_04230 [Rhizomicrobium sp.]|nr:hypothetical protein [Rhizomicrobium sp.]
MSEQKDAKSPKKSGKSIPVARIVTTPQEYEADHRTARARHISHYWNQALSWGLLMVLAMFSNNIESGFHHWFVQAVQQSSSLWVQIGYYVGLAVPPIGFFLVWLFLGRFFHFFQKQKWAVAVSQAQQTISPTDVTEGYTGLFTIYMRTKRRSYLLAGWGVLAFIFVFWAVVLNFSVTTPLDYWICPILVALTGWMLIRLGYAMTSTYLPGEVIVLHTLLLSIFAMSDVTSVQDARSQAGNDAGPFVHTNPWWFYPG